MLRWRTEPQGAAGADQVPADLCRFDENHGHFLPQGALHIQVAGRETIRTPGTDGNGR